MNPPGAAGPDRRRVALGLGAAAGCLPFAHPAAAQLAGAEILVTGPPGDGQDQLARAIAEGLASTQMTPRILTINLPREADALAQFSAGKRPRAALMVVGLSTLGALALEGQSARLDGCTPLARVIGEQLPVVVNAASKLRALPDLLEALRKDASQVSFAGRARGSADHQLALQLTQAAGGDAGRLAYRACGTSAEASTLALAGRVTAATGALWEFRQQIVGGTLRALGIASPERAVGSEVPTLKEQNVDVVLINWRGLLTREAIGPAIIARYGEAMRLLNQEAGWRELTKGRQWLDIYQPQEEFTRFLALERKRVAALLDGLGAK